MKRKWRTDVQKDTINIFHNGYYTNTIGKQVNIDKDSLSSSINKTRKYYKDQIIKKYNTTELPKLLEPQIFIVDDDCLEVGLHFKYIGYNPVVLNMASAIHPGGGYKNGAGAQEESIFRRTNLHLCLDAQRKKLYPIPRRGAIYTPNALIIKHSEFNNYIPTDYCYNMSFISAAAHKCHDDDIITVNGNKILNNRIEKMTKDKIDTIFELACSEGHDVIILSAFGCGAYGNPPYCIARLFKESMKKYGGHFRYVIFAIFGVF